MSKISVRFLIDREEKRVVFAEAGSDFIDVLFSFLTLPLGSIVRLLGKQTGLGSLDSIYESVEKIDAKDLQTEACKEMLLNPRSATARICEDLKIKNIHYDNPRSFYICKESDCMVQSKCYYTYVTMCRCGRCGKQMDMRLNWRIGEEERVGVFVNYRDNFIITDDLRVIPASLMCGFSLLEELRIKNAGILEERVVDVCTDEALNLLRRSLVSKRALTEICFPPACIEQNVKCFSVIKEELDGKEAEQKIKALNLLRRSLVSKRASTEICFPPACIEPSVKCFSVIKEEFDGNEAEHKINVKIILNKENNKILYAEVGGDFLNQLLSFLTFPLGSVFRLLGDPISLGGCISNLYSSVKSLGLDCFKSEKCKNMLVFPELASYYGCKNQMLTLDEMISEKWTISASCLKCFVDNGYKYCLTAPCKHGLQEAECIEQNPKLENGGSDFGGGFVEDSRRFMVADNLHISFLSCISSIKGMDILISDLAEEEVSVGKAEVMSLLIAMLISKTVLTDAFSPKLMKQRRRQYM